MAKSFLLKHTFVTFIAASILVVLSMFFWDESVANFFIIDTWAAFRQFCSDITDIGLGAPYFAFAISLFVLSKWVFPKIKYFEKKEHLVNEIKWWSIFSLKALFGVGLLLQFLKFSFGRQRPHLTSAFEGFHFSPFNMHWNWHSFPSGHAQVLFVVATILILAFPRYKFLVMLLAGFFAFSSHP